MIRKSAQLSLSSINSTYDLGSKPFRDTSLFALTGKVYQVCVGCLDGNGQAATITGPLDSVKVIGIGKNNSQTQHEADSSVTGYRNPPELMVIMVYCFNIRTNTQLLQNSSIINSNLLIHWLL
jgi:hypothetical protein